MAKKGVLGAIENLAGSVGKAAKTDVGAAWDAAGKAGDAIASFPLFHPSDPRSVLHLLTGGGGGTSASTTPAVPTYRAEDMINSVWSGLSAPQVQRIKDLLKQQGIDETSNVHAYRAALNALNASVPGLSNYSKDAAIFGGGTGGAGDVAALAQSLAAIDKPYMDDLNQRAGAFQGMMAPLIAKLPAGLAGMENVSTNQEVQGMKNLAASQLLAGQAQPVANALALQQRLQQSIGNTQLRDAILGIGSGATSAIPPLGPIPKTS